MAKKFKSNTDLDALVNTGVLPNQKTAKVNKSESQIVRKSSGIGFRSDYQEKVRLLATILKKKNYTVIEEALEMYFEVHKDTLDKFE